MNKAGILIIEDDKAIKNLIATTLEMHDYYYVWARCVYETGLPVYLGRRLHGPDNRLPPWCGLMKNRLPVPPTGHRPDA